MEITLINPLFTASIKQDLIKDTSCKPHFFNILSLGLIILLEQRPEKTPRNHVFNALELGESAFSKIARVANLKYCATQNENYPSPLLRRQGIEIIFRESTIGAIRLGTFFNLEGEKPFDWSNPTIFIGRKRVIFKSNDVFSHGEKIIVRTNDFEHTYPANR